MLETRVRSVGQEDPSPGEGNGNPLQYSCLGNPMDSGAWWATVLGVARVRHNWVTKQQPQVEPKLPVWQVDSLPLSHQGNPTSNLLNQKPQGWGLGVCMFRSLQFCDLCLRASLVAQLVKNPPAIQETPVPFLGKEDPLEKG